MSENQNVVVDISHHNRVSSFKQARNDGVQAVIHKVTQGTTFIDPTLKSNRKKIGAAGLLFGAYHFGVAGEPEQQAEFFLKQAGTDTLMVLDFEPNRQGQDMTLLEAEHFVHYLSQKTGRYPGLYSGHTIKEALVAHGITDPKQTELSECWLWLAQYGPAPLLPRCWDKWTLWQYTDGASGQMPHEVAGIGRCDRSMFNGSQAEFTAFWNGAAGGP